MGTVGRNEAKEEREEQSGGMGREACWKRVVG